MTQLRDPQDCTTMAEVRAGIDALDREIVRLLGRRFAFMDSAARIKPDRSAIRDEPRKAEVLERVAIAAVAAGIDQGLVRQLYEQLIEASIAYELKQFDRR